MKRRHGHNVTGATISLSAKPKKQKGDATPCTLLRYRRRRFFRVVSAPFGALLRSSMNP
jgi:hypothetical protein